MKRASAGLLFLCVPVMLEAQTSIAAMASTALADYAVDEGNGVELSSGPLIGARLRITLGQWFELDGAALVGRLTADSTFTEDRNVDEGRITASLTALPWLALQLGGHVRALETTLARQRWTTFRIGAEARMGFGSGAVRGLLRGGLMPIATITQREGPTMSFYTGAGLEWIGGTFTARVTYDLERFNFSSHQGVERRDQFAMLNASLGFQLGRARSPR